MRRGGGVGGGGRGEGGGGGGVGEGGRRERLGHRRLLSLRRCSIASSRRRISPARPAVGAGGGCAVACTPRERSHHSAASIARVHAHAGGGPVRPSCLRSRARRGGCAHSRCSCGRATSPPSRWLERAHRTGRIARVVDGRRVFGGIDPISSARRSAGSISSDSSTFSARLPPSSTIPTRRWIVSMCSFGICFAICWPSSRTCCARGVNLP